MIEDGEYAECPNCGSDALYFRCHEPGCNGGWIDMHADNPIEYEPGEVERCDVCLGKGHWWICQSESCKKAHRHAGGQAGSQPEEAQP